jgi:hypothetical protein
LAWVSKIEDLAQSLNLKVLTQSPHEFVRDRMILPCEDLESEFRIDFVFSFTPFERQAIERARVVSVGSTGVRFATPEDLIIHKMVAGRPRDEEDVRGMLLKTAGIDEGYIEGWLAQFDQALERPLLKRFRDLQRSTTDSQEQSRGPGEL